MSPTPLATKMFMWKPCPPVGAYRKAPGRGKWPSTHMGDRIIPMREDWVSKNRETTNTREMTVCAYGQQNPTRPDIGRVSREPPRTPSPVHKPSTREESGANGQEVHNPTRPGTTPAPHRGARHGNRRHRRITTTGRCADAANNKRRNPGLATRARAYRETRRGSRPSTHMGEHIPYARTSTHMGKPIPYARTCAN